MTQLTYKHHHANDFTVAPMRENAMHPCTGCWFFENEEAECWAEAADFASTIFRDNSPKQKGSCLNLIAVRKTPQ